MILITNTTAGTWEPLQIRNYPDSGAFVSPARLSRSKLLDGGSDFSHFGVTVADRDFDIKCRFTMDEAARVKALHKAAVLLKIAFWEGFFVGHIFRLTIRHNGEANIKFYFKEQLA